MRYIKSFQNDAAIQAAVDNGSLGKPYVAYNESAGTIDWNSKEEADYSKMYLTVEALGSGILKLRRGTTYSLNEGEWTTVTMLADGVSMVSGDKVRVKATTGLTFYESTIVMKAYGNVMSAAYGDSFVGQTTIPSGFNGFKNMFDACSGLVDVSNLVIPATGLTRGCYQAMFYDCTSLSTAPELPATTLVDYCYGEMFRGCSSLNYVKCLATDIRYICTDRWLKDVSATGTFVKDANTTWPTGNDGIPSGWTVINA